MNTIKVRDVMSQDLVTVYPNEDLVSVLTKMSEAGVRRLPVVAERSGDLEIVGMITDRDLRLASHSPYLWGTSEQIAKEMHALRTADVMKDDKLVTVPADATVAEAAEEMIKHHVGGLPVVDRDRGRDMLVGIVTRTDLLRCLIGLRESGEPV